MRHAMLLTLVIATTGCSVLRQPVPETAEAEVSLANPAFITPDIYADRGQANQRERDQIRTGRYTLTNTSPSVAQQELMSQIIEVTIPSSLKPTVGDAIRYTLSRSGYTLNAEGSEAGVLYSRVLPAAHYKLGPMRLRDTLQVLAGPAWKVGIDEVTRQVSFSLRPGYQLSKPSNISPSIAEKKSVLTDITPPIASAPIQPPSGQPGRLNSVESIKGRSHTSSTATPVATTSIPSVQPAISTSTKIAEEKTSATLANASASAITFKATNRQQLRSATETWSITIADKTLREALSRWAKKAQWTFEPEHWAVAVDIPLTANATVRGDFKSAVQQIVSTTELSTTPLQPCFYSNKVVRIVPYNEMCDRMAAR
ncbi:PFGI-1 class ICE element type IV pilus protein PilL2 [Stutzerimonas stutzeri]